MGHMGNGEHGQWGTYGQETHGEHVLDHVQLP